MREAFDQTQFAVPVPERPLLASLSPPNRSCPSVEPAELGVSVWLEREPQLATVCREHSFGVFDWPACRKGLAHQSEYGSA
jgi:hypothetical protein